MLGFADTLIEELVNLNKKDKKQINPEILRERQERRRAAIMYGDEDDGFGMTLFPGAFTGSTVSSTESTGLIQVIPLTSEQLDVYDDVYSYRRTHPVADDAEIYE